MKKFYLTLLLCLVICVVPHLLFAEALVCPKVINVQENVTEIPGGWTVASDGLSHLLKSIGFFDGHPEKRVGLAPDQEIKKKGFLYTTWSFDLKTAKNLWMSCTYGRTGLTMVRPVNKTFSQCTVKSNLTLQIDGSPEIVSIECK